MMGKKGWKATITTDNKSINKKHPKNKAYRRSYAKKQIKKARQKIQFF